MSTVQIESVEEPFRSHPDLAATAFQLLLTSQYVGALPPLGRRVLGPEVILELGKALGDDRATFALVELEATGGGWDPDRADEQLARYRTVLERLRAEVEGSPRPESEWQSVIDSLGDDLVADLVGTSASSIRRYSSGERGTPQDIAERLHFLALLLGELAGSYNNYGMRRWFSRPRSTLGGKAPGELMGKGFDADGPAGEKIRRLAEGLRAA